MSLTLNDHTFHTGICMAGAVSAGAYTVGVIDYLLEALEAWDEAKALALANVPMHNFSIDVLGGASAGGMTAAVTAAALQKKFLHVTVKDRDNEKIKRENPLYNAWINMTETANEDMICQLLSIKDIEYDSDNNRHKEVRAGLNSTFIKELAEKAITDDLPEKATDDNITKKDMARTYIAKDLDLFMTLTNLRGFNYQVTFQTIDGPRNYYMKMHRDYAFFKFGEPGNNVNSLNGSIPLHFQKPSGLNLDLLKSAAMATGAFPVGLESRTLRRQLQYITGNKYLNFRVACGYYRPKFTKS